MKNYLLYALSLFFFITGLVLSGVYAYEAFEVLGTSDRSTIYWYLPVLFAGLGAFMLSGVVYRMAKKSHIEMLDDV
jgi:hypothetical protein